MHWGGVMHGGGVVDGGDLVVSDGSSVVNRGSLVVSDGSSVVNRGGLVVSDGSSVVNRGSLVVSSSDAVVLRGVVLGNGVGNVSGLVVHNSLDLGVVRVLHDSHGGVVGRSSDVRVLLAVDTVVVNNGAGVLADVRVLGVALLGGLVHGLVRKSLGRLVLEDGDGHASVGRLVSADVRISVVRDGSLMHDRGVVKSRLNVSGGVVHGGSRVMRSSSVVNWGRHLMGGRRVVHRLMHSRRNFVTNGVMRSGSIVACVLDLSVSNSLSNMRGNLVGSSVVHWGGMSSGGVVHGGGVMHRGANVVGSSSVMHGSCLMVGSSFVVNGRSSVMRSRCVIRRGSLVVSHSGVVSGGGLVVGSSGLVVSGGGLVVGSSDLVVSGGGLVVGSSDLVAANNTLVVDNRGGMGLSLDLMGELLLVSLQLLGHELFEESLGDLDVLDAMGIFGNFSLVHGRCDMNRGGFRSDNVSNLRLHMRSILGHLRHLRHLSHLRHLD
jgi:hypothetical protein